MDDPLNTLQKVELAMIRAEYQKQYQMQISYLKAQVGAGTTYRNAVVQIVVSEKGAYYELNDLPEEFGGAAGETVETRFVAAEKVTELLARAVASLSGATPENTRHLSLLLLYSRRGLADRKTCYVVDYRPEDETPERPPLVIGTFQPEVMPLFFKVKIDADFAQEALEMPRGMIFGMANTGERHLLVQVPFTGEQVFALQDLPTTKTIH
jgi:hypothetical protein